MSAYKDFEAANRRYASAFAKGDLSLPPNRKVIVIGCMDARFDPSKALGLEEGDAHVIRNAGGRTIEALRSVIISQQLLGTKEIVVVHHTDCGMLTFSDSELRQKVRAETGLNADHFSFLPFHNLTQSVLDDIDILEKCPFVLNVTITGYIYDVKTGTIKRVK